jgi:hypothetical protein
MLATGGIEGFAARHAIHIVLAVAWATGTAVAWALVDGARRTAGNEHDDARVRRQLAGHELVALLSGRVLRADAACEPPALATQWVGPLLALASLGAAAVHVAVCPGHLAESTLYGLFFIGAAIAQAGWASAILVRPTRQLVVLGVAGNLAVMALWGVSRTLGLPVGPAPGVPEVPGAVDALATAYEMFVVAVGSWVLWGRLPFPATARWRDWAPSARAVLVATAGITATVLLAFPLQA